MFSSEYYVSKHVTPYTGMSVTNAMNKRCQNVVKFEVSDNVSVMRTPEVCTCYTSHNRSLNTNHSACSDWIPKRCKCYISGHTGCRKLQRNYC